MLHLAEASSIRRNIDENKADDTENDVVSGIELHQSIKKIIHCKTYP